MLRILFLLISLGGSIGLRNPGSYDEYDCDSNGAKDCSAWDFRNMKCAQPNAHAADIRVQRICVKGASFGLLGTFSPRIWRSCFCADFIFQQFLYSALFPSLPCPYSTPGAPPQALYNCIDSVHINKLPSLVFIDQVQPLVVEFKVFKIDTNEQVYGSGL